jgi:intracellular septation protein
MKLFLDFFPIIVFFAGFKLADIYVATGAAIAATIAVMIYQWLTKRPIEPMQWVGLAIIVVFGGATIFFKDENFIKWKPTVLYWCFAVALLVSAYALGKNLMRSLMGKQMTLPEAVWSKLNLLWAAYFIVMGIINLFVAYTYSTETWVNFKLFGSLGLTLAFIVSQAMYLGRYAQTKSDN